jgi:hypothetical protein
VHSHVYVDIHLLERLCHPRINEKGDFHLVGMHMPVFIFST